MGLWPIDIPGRPAAVGLLEARDRNGVGRASSDEARRVELRGQIRSCLGVYFFAHISEFPSFLYLPQPPYNSTSEFEISESSSCIKNEFGSPGFKNTAIRLVRDRNVIEPGELFFKSGSTVAAAHPLFTKAGKNLCRRKRRNEWEREGWGRGGESRAVIRPLNGPTRTLELGLSMI